MSKCNIVGFAAEYLERRAIESAEEKFMKELRDKYHVGHHQGFSNAVIQSTATKTLLNGGTTLDAENAIVAKYRECILRKKVREGAFSETSGNRESLDSMRTHLILNADSLKALAQDIIRQCDDILNSI